MGELRARGRKPDLGHRLAEEQAILGLVDGMGLGADHLDIELFERAVAEELERGVERGLPAHGWQKRHALARMSRALALDDLGDDFRRDRLDIGRVGQIRVCHDRRRIGIDQDDPVSLGLESLARLRAGIVEFAGLADHDRASPYDEDGSQYLCVWAFLGRSGFGRYKGSGQGFNNSLRGRPPGECSAEASSHTICRTLAGELASDMLYQIQ